MARWMTFGFFVLALVRDASAVLDEVPFDEVPSEVTWNVPVEQMRVKATKPGRKASAVVVDTKGREYVVRVSGPFGPTGARVARIERDRVVVSASMIDVEGRAHALCRTLTAKGVESARKAKSAEEC